MELEKILYVNLENRIYRKGDCMEITDRLVVSNNIYSGVKKDCFGYSNINNRCSVLTETVCKNKECRFYKTKKEFEKGRMKHE